VLGRVFRAGYPKNADILSAEAPVDRTNGYEDLAEVFMRSRNPRIGPRIMADWAREFPPGAEILELGCGHGVVSKVLVEAGLRLFALDASPTLLQAFQQQFPQVETQCSTAEESDFFGRSFDGVVAWGLIFLLEEAAQIRVLTKAAQALRAGGRLVFTTPVMATEWTDAMTRRPSLSLGAKRYGQLLRGLGLEISPGVEDEGQNYYVFATRMLALAGPHG
jgi:2-polyprenyl-3-methyl-5-hydroxy-6-metoxy-1,4-benzoquinol methylase